MVRTEHWNRVFAKLNSGEESWFQRHLARSLALIEQAELPRDASIIDVGAGVSTLADDLLDLGFGDVTVLDISAVAVETSRSRLGERASRIHWMEADVLSPDLPASRFDLWHDRAVFHFLTEATDRDAYRASLDRALRPGGQFIVATFALSGPERCSGLPVTRYDAGALQREFGPGFQLITSEEEAHRTPSGNRQDFLYCRFRRS